MMGSLFNDVRDGNTMSSIRDLRKVIVKCAKTIKSNDETFNISTLPDVAEKLSDLISEYVDMVQQLEASQKTFDFLYNDYIEPEQREGCEGEPFELSSVQIEFDQHFRQANENLTEESEAQIELNEALRPEMAERQQDEEIMIEAPAQQIPRDPITKKIVQVAVKSLTCKHIYDQGSIENYFEQKEKARQRVQCPVAGCQNRNMKKTELKLDEEINRLIGSR